MKTKDLLDALHLVAGVRRDRKPGVIGHLILSRVACYLESRLNIISPFRSIESANSLVGCEWLEELEAAYQEVLPENVKITLDTDRSK